MSSSTRMIRVALLAAAAADLAVAAFQLRGKHRQVELAVQSIHDQLDAPGSGQPRRGDCRAEFG